MEFVDGGQVNDRAYMERNKIDVNEVRLRAHSHCAGDPGLPSEGSCAQVRAHCLQMGPVV